MYRKIMPEEISVDLLRAIVNKSRKYSVIVLVNGHGQIGKTTFIWYLANRIMQIKKYNKLNPNDPNLTWKEWDGRKLTATNAFDFVNIWNHNNDSVMALAEASETLYYADWFTIMARVFNSTTTTQQMKRNICFLDTVMSTEIMKKARDKVDFRIEVKKRIDFLRFAEIRSGIVLIDYLRDRWTLIPYNKWDLTYSLRMLLISKKYTDWVAEDLKEETARRNEQLVMGYDPRKPINDNNIPLNIRELL